MKKLLLIALALVLVGCAVIAAAGASLDFDLGNLDGAAYETHTHTVTEPFTDIRITATEADITFVPATNGKCTVLCYEPERLRHAVSVEGGALTVTCTDERGLLDRFGLDRRRPELTVYLPESAYAALRIETGAGDVAIPSDFRFDAVSVRGDAADVECLAPVGGALEIAVTAGDVELVAVSVGSLDVRTTTGEVLVSYVRCAGDAAVHVTTGRAEVEDLYCASFASTGDSGGLTLKNVLAAGELSVTRSTGDVRFDACDADSLRVRTDTGDVTGTLRTAKTFVTATDTGKVSVPATAGGPCDIRTDTGDIRIELG